MNDNKDELVISKLRGEDDTTPVSLRLPNSLLEKLDSICAQSGRNRTNIIIIALDYALDKIKIEDKESW